MDTKETLITKSDLDKIYYRQIGWIPGDSKIEKLIDNLDPHSKNRHDNIKMYNRILKRINGHEKVIVTLDTPSKVLIMWSIFECGLIQCLSDEVWQ